MKRSLYLLDTHTLIFWCAQDSVSKEFIQFFDKQDQVGNVLVSPISFWEAALLVRKGKLKIDDIGEWSKELLANTNLGLLQPSVSEMIESVQLPDHHKDPFDRLLIVQANHSNASLVTKDENICKYAVDVFWL